MSADDALARLRSFEQPPAEYVSQVPAGRGRPALDYVGHADTTRILLDADPQWTWEPAGWERDIHGQPVRPVLETDPQGRPVGMWIRLTVGGVSRLGYGSCEAGKGDAVKELIGDAIRNAAMRFGVALNLWSRSDVADRQHDGDGKTGRETPPVEGDRDVEGEAKAALEGMGMDERRRRDSLRKTFDSLVKAATDADDSKGLDELRDLYRSAAADAAIGKSAGAFWTLTDLDVLDGLVQAATSTVTVPF